MIDDLILAALTGEQRRILKFLANVGVLGGTDEEVAVYLITRGLDDMARSGVLKLGNDA